MFQPSPATLAQQCGYRRAWSRSEAPGAKTSWSRPIPNRRPPTWRLPCRPLRPGALWLDGQPFGGEGRVGDSGLRDGAVVQVAAPNGRPPARLSRSGGPEAGWEVAVVSGPEAGPGGPPDHR